YDCRSWCEVGVVAEQGGFVQFLDAPPVTHAVELTRQRELNVGPKTRVGPMQRPLKEIDSVAMLSLLEQEVRQAKCRSRSERRRRLEDVQDRFISPLCFLSPAERRVAGGQLQLDVWGECGCGHALGELGFPCRRQLIACARKTALPAHAQPRFVLTLHSEDLEQFAITLPQGTDAIVHFGIRVPRRHCRARAALDRRVGVHGVTCATPARIGSRSDATRARRRAPTVFGWRRSVSRRRWAARVSRRSRASSVSFTARRCGLRASGTPGSLATNGLVMP